MYMPETRRLLPPTMDPVAISAAPKVSAAPGRKVTSAGMSSWVGLVSTSTVPNW
jgi:hypothetical protein